MFSRNRLARAVSGSFGEEAHFEFFGSAVNGFETSSSDTWESLFFLAKGSGVEFFFVLKGTKKTELETGFLENV